MTQKKNGRQEGAWRPLGRRTGVRYEEPLVGGIKEKILAAHRAGIKRIIMPDRNQKDMVDVPEQARNEMEFFFVKKIDELLPLALTEMPEKFGKPSPGATPVVVTPPTTTTNQTPGSA
jgi:hypothetical protein